jgi:hypothetical protein
MQLRGINKADSTGKGVKFDVLFALGHNSQGLIVRRPGIQE